MLRTASSLFRLALWGAALAAGAACGQCEPAEAVKITSEPGIESAWFGQSVGIGERWAIVGSPGSDGVGPGSGLASLYEWDGEAWESSAVFTGADGAAGDSFGFAVATSGDWVVVGAPGKAAGGEDAGGAYVFAWNGASWIAAATLVAADGQMGDQLGAAVAIHSGGGGDRVILGAPGDDDAGTDAGSAYVFRRAGNSWVQEAKLVPEAGDAGQSFGSSVGLGAGDAGDAAIVGAPGFDGFGADAGRACVFERAGQAWTLAGVLGPEAPAPGARFGATGATTGGQGGITIVGAPGQSGGGGAYVIEKTGGAWNVTAAITPAEGENDGAFGAAVAVALSGGSPAVMIGAPALAGPDSPDGKAFIFRRSGGDWVLYTSLNGPFGGARFGASVALTGSENGDHAVGGAPSDDDIGADAGSASFFQHAFEEWGPAGRFIPPAPADEAILGRTCDIDGDWAIAGTMREDPKEHGVGAAYVYHRTQEGWARHSTLHHDPGADVKWYAFSVAILGGPEGVWAFVGIHNSIGSGLLDVFRLVGDEWNRVGTLTGSDTGGGDGFGGSIAVCHGPGGDRLIASATGWDQQFKFNAGAAYVFRRDGESWIEEARLVAADMQEQVDFAYSVAIASGPGGDRAVVGCPGDETVKQRSGAVYVYRRDGGTWAQEAKIIPADVGFFDNFGLTVDIESGAAGDRFIGASYYDDDKGDLSGSVYVYRRDGGAWEQEAKLVAPDGKPGDEFGRSVALVESPDGLTAAVGAPWRDADIRNSIPDAGGVYLFRLEEQKWLPAGVLLASDAAPGALLGWGGAGSDAGGEPRLTIGAPYDDANGLNSGAAYVFELCPAGCYPDVNGDGLTDIFDFLAFVNLFNEGQEQADCDGSGSLDLFDFLCFVSAFNAGC